MTAARGQFIPAQRPICFVTFDDFSVTGIQSSDVGKGGGLRNGGRAGSTSAQNLLLWTRLSLESELFGWVAEGALAHTTRAKDLL